MTISHLSDLQFQIVINVTEEVKQGNTRPERKHGSWKVRRGLLEDLTLEVRPKDKQPKGRAFQVEGMASMEAQRLNHVW